MKKALYILSPVLILAFTIQAHAASNLWEYWGGNLPSIEDRALVYNGYGFEDIYEGLSEQNIALLSELDITVADFPVLGSGGSTRRTSPAISSTDNAVVRFNGTDGGLIQNSGVIIDDSDNMSGIGILTVTSCVGCGGSAFAWTPDADVNSPNGDPAVATSTLTIHEGGLISHASSTFSSNLTVEGAFSASSTLVVAATSTFNSRMTIGTSSPHNVSSLFIEALTPSESGLIIHGTDDQTAPLFQIHEGVGGVSVFAVESNGEVEIVYIATETNPHSLHIETDAAGFGGVNGILVNYDTGALAISEDTAILLLSLNRFASTNGGVNIVQCLSTTGSAEAECLHVGVGMSALHQTVGTFGDMDECTDVGVDILSSCTSTSSDVEIFSLDNDELVIGDAATFGEITFQLATEAGGAGIKPKFEYSTGNDAWTEFNAVDGTNGMRNSGNIVIPIEDISWATGTSSRFFIRITRTQNSIPTAPVEDIIQISAVTDFRWNEFGNIIADGFFASSTSIFGGLTTLAGFISTASSTATGILNVQGHLSASTTLSVASNITIDANGNILCTTCIPAGSYDAGSIDGDDINSNFAGAHLTETAASPDTLGIETQVVIHTTTFPISSSTMSTTTDVVQHKWSQNITISRISCTTNVGGGTSTIQFFIRTELQPTVAGTNVLTSDLACGPDHTSSSTSFNDATISADAPISFEIADAENSIVGSASTPQQIRVHVDYTIDDV